MFPEVDALPGSQAATPLGDGQGERSLRQDASHMGRHVIGPFVDVFKERVAIGHQTRRKPLQIRPHRRIRIFANDEGRAGVMNKDIAQTDSDTGSGHSLLNLRANFRGAATAGGNGNDLGVHAHVQECRAARGPSR